MIFGGCILYMNGESVAAIHYKRLIANIADNVTVDCNLAAAEIIIKYPVFWMKGEEKIVVKHQNRAPDIYPGLLNHSYSVRQGVQSGALVISLMISSVEAADSGAYKCYDSDQHQHPRVLFQAYNVSVVSCSCPTPEGLEDITGDTRVRVNCTLNGYMQSSHVGDTLVNITLGNYAIQGNVKEDHLTFNVAAYRLCHNRSIEFKLNPEFHLKIRCSTPTRSEPVSPC